MLSAQRHPMVEDSKDRWLPKQTMRIRSAGLRVAGEPLPKGTGMALCPTGTLAGTRAQWKVILGGFQPFWRVGTAADDGGGGRYERSGDSVLDAALINGCGDGSLDRSAEVHNAHFSRELSL